MTELLRAYDAVASTMRRLDDELGEVWSYDEVLGYIKDGYNMWCRRSRCLFDMHVIPNVPQVGNWSTDLEKYLAEHTPGMGLTDNPLHFTGSHEANLAVGGRVGGSTEGPTPATSPSEAALFSAKGLPTKVATGRLPDGTADVLRITWDELELFPEGSADERLLDSQYEQRDGGDPRQYTLDKDGINTVRLVPPARGDAEYPTVSGSWGTMTQTDDTTISVVGTYGILRESDGYFPAGGPHGTPTQRHPAAKNIVAEIARVGRSLDGFAFEIPQQYVKYIIFWAMHRALERDGPGQDLKLSKHYSDRYGLGIERIKARLRKVNKEQRLRMGSGGETDLPFNMGNPTLPHPFGPAVRKGES